MDFEGNFAEPEVAGGLLVHAATDAERHDLAFARRQRTVALLQSRPGRGRPPPSTVALDPELDGVEQLLIVESLGLELDHSRVDRPDGHANVAVAGEEYDRKVNAGRDQLALEASRSGPPSVPIDSDRGAAAP